MTTSKWLTAILVVGCASFLTKSPPPAQAAQDEPAGAASSARNDASPKSAASRVVAVTVYQGNALVTREVSVAAGKGLNEIVVTPLPPQTVDSSLYAEGTDGVRVLSTRYRTRAVKEDTRKEVRTKEMQIHNLAQDAERVQKEIQVIEQNFQLLTKLENFTSATMQNLAEKGLLNSEATLALAKYVMASRTERHRRS